jgi:hypothetical protein
VGSFEVPQLASRILRWLRQGGAVLCLIALLAIPVGFNAPALAGAIEDAGISMMKHEPSSPIEDVGILNSAPYIDALCPGGETGEIFGTYANLARDISDGRWADHRTGGGSVALLSVKNRAVGVEHAHGGPAFDISGGGLAEVFDSYLRLDCSAPIRNLDNSILYGDISPQLPVGGSPHYENSSYQSQKLKKCDRACDDGDLFANTQSVQPVLYSLAIVGIGFFLCLFGGGLFDDGRRLIGGLIFVFGLLLGGLGILPWGFL